MMAPADRCRGSRRPATRMRCTSRSAPGCAGAVAARAGAVVALAPLRWVFLVAASCVVTPEADADLGGIEAGRAAVLLRGTGDLEAAARLRAAGRQFDERAAARV